MTGRIQHIVNMLPGELAEVVNNTLRGHKLGSVIPSNITSTELCLIWLLEELVELNKNN